MSRKTEAGYCISLNFSPNCHKINTMENFVLSNANVNLTIGTTELPKLIAIIAAKKGIGMSFCIKIEHKYFMVNEKYMNKTALSF